MLSALSPMQDYQTWTPTWANVTMGASTSTGWYVRLMGRWIVFDAVLTLGAGWAFPGNPRCNLPVPAASTPALPVANQFNGRMVRPAAECRPLFFDGGGDGTNAPYPLGWATGGTYATWAYITSAIPIAWATGDKLQVHGRYLAESPV